MNINPGLSPRFAFFSPLTKVSSQESTTTTTSGNEEFVTIGASPTHSKKRKPVLRASELLQSSLKSEPLQALSSSDEGDNSQDNVKTLKELDSRQASKDDAKENLSSLSLNESKKGNESNPSIGKSKTLKRKRPAPAAKMMHSGKPAIQPVTSSSDSESELPNSKFATPRSKRKVATQARIVANLSPKSENKEKDSSSPKKKKKKSDKVGNLSVVSDERNADVDMELSALARNISKESVQFCDTASDVSFSVHGSPRKIKSPKKRAAETLTEIQISAQKSKKIDLTCDFPAEATSETESKKKSKHSHKSKKKKKKHSKEKKDKKEKVKAETGDVKIVLTYDEEDPQLPNLHKSKKPESNLEIPVSQNGFTKSEEATDVFIGSDLDLFSDQGEQAPKSRGSDQDMFLDEEEQTLLSQEKLQGSVQLTKGTLPVSGGKGHNVSSESSDEEAQPPKSATPVRKIRSKKETSSKNLSKLNSEPPDSSDSDVELPKAPQTPVTSGGKDKKLRFSVPEDMEEFDFSSIWKKVYLEDVGKEKELWLIQTPVDFDVSQLNGQGVILNGSHTLNKSGEERKYEVLSTREECLSAANLNLLLPRKRDQKLKTGPSFSGRITIVEAVQVPPVQIPDPVVRNYDLPPGLRQRFQPFGSGTPVEIVCTDTDVSKGEKKKKKKKKKAKEKEEEYALPGTKTSNGDEQLLEQQEKHQKHSKKKKKKHKKDTA